MVKIERKDTEKTRQAIQSLASEKKKASGKCNTPEVVEALEEIFHDKCYICESKNAVPKEIEHLRPHGGNADLKFDWNNLFLACAYCNHIKSDKYTPIWDCTQVEVDELISFRKAGHFGTDESLTFAKVEGADETLATAMTCELLQRVYHGKTKQEEFGAKILRNAVISELSKFKNCIRNYRQSSGEDKEDLSELIKKDLKSNSQFVAFKRWVVRDNPDWCNDFIDCWKN